MALSRRKKIIIGVAALVGLALIVIISVVATRKDEPEVTTVKVEVRPELRSTVTASGEVRPVQYIKLTSEVPGRTANDRVTDGNWPECGMVCGPASSTSLATAFSGTSWPESDFR